MLKSKLLYKYRYIKFYIKLLNICFKSSLYPSVLTKVKYNDKIWEIIPDGTFTNYNVNLRQVKKYKNPKYGLEKWEPKYLYEITDEIEGINPKNVKFCMTLSNFIRSFKYYHHFYNVYWLDIWISDNNIPNFCPIYQNKHLK